MTMQRDLLLILKAGQRLGFRLGFAASVHHRRVLGEALSMDQHVSARKAPGR